MQVTKCECVTSTSLHLEEMKTTGVHEKQNRRLYMYEAEKVWRRRVSGQGPLDQTNTPPPSAYDFSPARF